MRVSRLELMFQVNNVSSRPNAVRSGYFRRNFYKGIVQDDNVPIHAVAWIVNSWLKERENKVKRLPSVGTVARLEYGSLFSKTKKQIPSVGLTGEA